MAGASGLAAVFTTRGRLDYGSGQHHHSGVTTEDRVQAVVNNLVARVAMLHGEDHRTEHTAPQPKRAAPAATTAPKRARGAAAASVVICPHCGQLGHTRRSFRGCGKHIPRGGGGVGGGGA
eukprot:SAG11_NODE_695_length_7694_cov_5.002502_2_plen_121_part_00